MPGCCGGSGIRLDNRPVCSACCDCVGCSVRFPSRTDRKGSHTDQQSSCIDRQCSSESCSCILPQCVCSIDMAVPHLSGRIQSEVNSGHHTNNLMRVRVVTCNIHEGIGGLDRRYQPWRIVEILTLCRLPIIFHWLSICRCKSMLRAHTDAAWRQLHSRCRSGTVDPFPPVAVGMQEENASPHVVENIGSSANCGQATGLRPADLHHTSTVCFADEHLIVNHKLRRRVWRRCGPSLIFRTMDQPDYGA